MLDADVHGVFSSVPGEDGFCAARAAGRLTLGPLLDAFSEAGTPRPGRKIDALADLRAAAIEPEGEQRGH
jgi:hypothetical protein